MDGFPGYRTVLLGNIYGHNKKFVKNTNVVATIIKLMYSAQNSNIDLVLYGSGKDRRCFTHLSDLNTIITKLKNNVTSNLEPIIVSDSRDESIKDLASYIAESLDFRNEIRFKDLESESYTAKKIDNSSLLKSIGDYDFIDLKSGINLTVEEYLRSLSIT
jgi:nucleoside-diphosphate-sugar epimerase